MDLVRDLARSLNELDRLAKRHGDEELEYAVSKLAEQLNVLVGVLGKLSTVYEELEFLIKGVLKLDTPVLAEISIKDGEDLAKFVERAAQAGVDHNRLLAYLLGSGLVKLYVEGERVLVKAAQQRRSQQQP